MMHEMLTMGGGLLVLMIIVHIVFRVVKTTIIVFLLGLGLIALITVFKQSFGIDLLSFMSSGTAPH